MTSPFRGSSDYSPGKLLVRPRPLLDESLTGYLIRVAEANSYSTVGWLLDMADLPISAVTRPTNLRTLAERLSVDLGMLQDRAYWQPPRRTAAFVTFFTDVVRRHQILRQTARVCPACLRERAYCRAHWDIRMYAACHLHSRLMLEKCPKCSHQITWRRRKVSHCGECDFDFRNHEAPQARFEVATICRRIAESISRSGWVSLNQKPLDALPLMEMLDLIQISGAYAIGIRNQGAAIGLARKSPEHIALILEAAYDVLEDWPNGFFRLLGDIRIKSPESPRGGLAKEFEDLYSTMNRRFPRRHFLRRAFSDYVAKEWSGGYPTSRFKWLDIRGSEHRTYFTRPEAAKELEISPQTVDVLLREGELEGQINPNGMYRSFAFVTRDSLKAYQRRRKHIIESEAAAGRLGVSRATYRDLVRAGVLKPNGARVSSRPRKAFEIDSRQIDRLLHNLERRTPSGSDGPTIGYTSAATRFGQAGRRKADLLKAILKNKMAPAAIDPTAVGLRRIRFDEEALARFLKVRHESKVKVLDPICGNGGVQA